MARRKPELTEEELQQTDGEPLPDREAMSVIRGPVEYPLPDDVYPVEPDPPRGGVVPLDDPPSGA